MDLPPLIHHQIHHHNNPPRYVHVPSQLPDDPNFYGNRRHHNHHHLPQPSPVLPPPPPPPSYRPLPAPPPPPPFSSHQSQFTFRNPNPSPNSIRLIDDEPGSLHHRPHHHLLDVARSPRRVSSRTLLDDDRRRLRVHQFDNSRSEFWESSRVSTENRPPRLYPVIRSDHENSHHRSFNHNPVSPLRAIDEFRHDPEGSSRFRDELNREFEHKRAEELMWVRGEGRSHDDLDRHSHFIENSNKSLRNISLGESHFVLESDSSSLGKNYDSRYGSSRDEEFIRNGRGDGLSENQRWAHIRQPQRDVTNYLIGTENNEIDDGGGIQVYSFKRGSNAPELGKFTNRGSREGSHEFTRSPRKKIQKKSALLRIQLQKPNPRKRDEGQFYYDESSSSQYRSKDPLEYLDHGMEDERERSPVELDVSFKSNSLVAKAIMAPSSPSVISDRNLCLIPSNREIRKMTLPNMDNSSSQQNQLNEEPVKLDCFPSVVDGPSFSDKDPKHAKEKVTSSGFETGRTVSSHPCSNGTNISLGNNGAEGSLNSMIPQKVASSIGPGGMSSTKVTKKKKVVRKVSSSRVSNSQFTKKPGEAPGGSTHGPSAPSSANKGSAHPKENITSAGLISVWGINEVTTLCKNNKVYESLQSNVSEKSVTDIVSGQACFAELTEKRNSSSPPSGFSSQKDTNSHEGPTKSEGSMHDLSVISNSEKGPTRSQNELTCTDIDGMSDACMQICQNGPCVSLENDSLKGLSEPMLSVRGDVNVCLSSFEETKIHDSLAKTSNSISDLNIGSNSGCDVIKTRDKISTADTGHAGAVSRHPCPKQVSMSLENPRPVSLGGNASVPVPCSVENRIHEDSIDVDDSSNGMGTALSSDNSLAKSQEKITDDTGSVDDAGKQLSQDGIIMSVENGAIERPPKDMASMGGRLNVDSVKDCTPKGKKKRKIITSQSDSSRSAKVPVKPLNVITSSHDLDAISGCSMKGPNPANSYVGGLKGGSESCEYRMRVLNGNSSMKDLSEGEVSFRYVVEAGQNKNSPRLKKKKKSFVPHPGFSSPMGPEIPKESLIPDASTIVPEVPSNPNDSLAQSEEQVPVSGINMSATGLRPCLEGKTELLENSATSGNFEAMSSVRDDLSGNGLKFPQANVIVEELTIPSLQPSCPSELRVEPIEISGTSSPDHQNEIMDLETGIRERIGVHGLEKQGMLQRGIADCKSTAALQTPDLNHGLLSKGMECDTHTIMKDNLPTLSNHLSVAADGNGASATNFNDQLMQSLPDTLANMASPETLPIIPGLYMLDTEPSLKQISDQKVCGSDRKSDEKPMVHCGSLLFAHNSCSQNSGHNLKLADAIRSDNSIKGKSVQPSSEDTKRTTRSANVISAELGSKNHLNNLVPRVFPAPSSSFLANSKKTASSTHIAKPRTWYRTGASSSSSKKPLSNALPPQRQLKKFGKAQGTSYIRKGNSLVRKSAPVAIIPQGSHGLISSVYRLNPSGIDEMRRRTVSESRSDVIDPSNHSSTEAMNAPSERPQTPPLLHSTKLPKCSTISSGDYTTSPLADSLLNGCSGNMPDHTENINVPMSSEDGPKSSGSTENLIGLINNLESQTVLNDGNSESSKLKKITYVKRKSNQLVAAANPHDMSVQNADKTQAISSDGYYKRRKNQLIRTSLESHIKQTVAIPDDSSNSEAQRLFKPIISKSYSKRPSDKVSSKTHKPSKFSLVWTLRGAQSSEKDGNSVHSQGVLPSLFPWKRATYWKTFMHNPASIPNRTSLSMISRKLLLSRKRDTVYTRSTGGFSLRKSKVLSVGGASLKWSKSIERWSKKANEEATLAVAAVERKKREQNSAVSVISKTESRNHSSRKSVHYKMLHPGERIFRVGSVRYKMDSSRRTLQRISDGESTCSAAFQSEKNAKKTYIPRRLLIGNDEYVQIGNGNQLIRNPKKRTRILASEKVRWSLHTARLRLAKKWKYCQFFTRFGKCNKDDGKCPYIHDPSKIAVCTKFLNGLCSNPNCKLTHKVLFGSGRYKLILPNGCGSHLEVIPERMPDCSYFLQGLCNNESCPYRHVNVNPNASVCEGFLRGYCADGDECRKKHSYVCPIFEATGSCPQGSKCKLHHPKNRSKGKKKKQSRELNARVRYFGFRHVSNGDPEASEKDTAKKDDDISFREGRFSDYICLDVSDEEVGNIEDLRTQHTTLFSSEPSYLHLDNLDELIKPVLIMNKNLTT